MKKIDKSIFIITFILIGIGLIMVYSSSAFSAIRSTNTSVFFLRKHLFTLSVGLVVFVAMVKIDYHFWGKCSYFILSAVTVLLIAVLIFGTSVNGAQRWLRLAGFSIQPSEIAKLGVIIFIADFVSRKDLKNLKKGLLPVLGILATIALLIGLEPSFGALSVICFISLVLLFLGGAKISHLLVLLLIVGGIGFVSVSQFPYAKARVFGFMSQQGYQIHQSIYGIGCGGLFGKGLGNGQEKLLFLPFSHTDFIFSIIGEELGFIGCAGISLLFFGLLIKGIKIGTHAQSQFGFLLACGISFVIFVSACLHIGVSTGLLPTTGISLPLISFGGSSLLTNLAGIGILLNISKNNKVVAKDKMKKETGVSHILKAATVKHQPLQDV